MKKQEGDIGGKAEAPTSHECPEGEEWSESEGKCVPANAEPGEVEADLVSGTSLLEAVSTVVKEYVDKMLKEFRKELHVELEKERKNIKIEMEQGLRKSLGIEVDPPIHMSDLSEFARKLQLETAESGKRSPASKMAGVGPEGNVEETATAKKQWTSMLKEYGFAEEAK